MIKKINNIIHDLPLSFYLKLVTAAIGFFYVSDLIMHPNIISTDFKSYLFAGKAVLNNGNIYDVKYLNLLANNLDIQVVYPYLYPPLLAFIMTPLAYLSPFLADKIWLCILCTFVSIVVYFTIYLGDNYHKKINPSTKSENKYITIFFSILLLIILPFRQNVILGQINIMLLAFIVLLFNFQLKNYKKIAAFFLSLCILIKVTPALLLFYFLIRKDYKTILYTALFSLILIGLSITFGAFESWKSFLHFLPQTGYGVQIEGLFSLNHPLVFSPSAFLERLFGKNQLLISIFTWTLNLIMLFAILIQGRKLKNKELLLLPLLIVMLTVSPITYIHHLVFLMPGLFILLIYIYQNFSKGERKVFLMTVLFLSQLICTEFPKYYAPFKNILIFNLLARASFYSLNLFFLILLFIFSLYINNIVIRRQNKKNELIAA